MTTYIVLLRAIGPITHKLMSMAQWRDAAAADGFGDPQTYVATGNMIVNSDLPKSLVTTRMDAIVATLGLAKNSKAIVRTARQLQSLLRANPFPDAAISRPSEIGVYFFAQPRPDFSWLGSAYSGSEKVHVAGSHLIIDYDGRGSASSLPAMVERKSGLVTARNWNTLSGLAERSTARNQ